MDLDPKIGRCGRSGRLLRREGDRHLAGKGSSRDKRRLTGPLVDRNIDRCGGISTCRHDDPRPSTPKVVVEVDRHDLPLRHPKGRHLLPTQRASTPPRRRHQRKEEHTHEPSSDSQYTLHPRSLPVKEPRRPQGNSTLPFHGRHRTPFREKSQLSSSPHAGLRGGTF